MKQIMYIIVLMMIGSTYALWPNEKEDRTLDYIASPALSQFDVEITGAVVFPGIYTMYEPKTISELIAYAGGFLPTAKTDHIALGQLVQRKHHLHVETITQIETPIIPKVNINKASFKMLTEVPYITESIAASIIIYREQHGPFFHLDELIHVKHIGQKTLDKIKPYLSLG